MIKVHDFNALLRQYHKMGLEYGVHIGQGGVYLCASEKVFETGTADALLVVPCRTDRSAENVEEKLQLWLGQWERNFMPGRAPTLSEKTGHRSYTRRITFYRVCADEYHVYDPVAISVVAGMLRRKIAWDAADLELSKDQWQDVGSKLAHHYIGHVLAEFDGTSWKFEGDLSGTHPQSKPNKRG